VLIPQLKTLAMEKVEKILLALDGSNLSRQALQAAKTTALSHGAKVVVFGCLNLNELSQPPEFNPVSYVNAIQEAESNLKQHLEQATEELREASIEASTSLARGKPVRAIVEAAEEVAADLIVMASHGRSGLRRLLVGSVTEGVLRRTHCPLLVYPVKE
jgi:nucleotide-binding universal stress UspA family protein